MPEVKISLKIDDAGALAKIAEFNRAFKILNKSTKKASVNLNKMAKSTTTINTKFGRLNKTMQSGLRKTTSGIKKQNKELRNMHSIGSTIKNVFAGVFISDALRSGIFAIKTAIVSSVEAFARFETGLVGVGKTANISGKELENLGRAIKNLDIPIENDRLLELAKIAGQLGIKGSNNILKFAETMGKLEVATDIAGEAGASQIARILNITKEATDTVDVFGSVIVSLGNNFAATESEILRVTNEVARSAGQFGITSAEAAAFGAVIKSLGGRAEGAGTALGKLFRKLNEGIEQGGPLLRSFADILNVTQTELKDMFKSNPTKTVVAFLESMKKARGEGESMSLILKRIGLDTDRVSKVLPTLALRVDEVQRAFNLANAEVENATALNKEASAAFNTLASDYSSATKDISSATTDLVEKVNPAMRAITRAVGDAALSFRAFLAKDDTARLDIYNIQLARLEEQLRKANEAGDSFLTTIPIQARISEINALRRIIIKTKEELLSPQEREGILPVPAPSGGEDFENENLVKKLTDRQKLLNQFANAEKLLVEQQFAEGKTFAILQENERIEFITKNLGVEASIRLTARVKDLTEQEKFAQAAKLIRDTERKAREAEAKKDKELEKTKIADRKAALNTIVTLSRSSNKTLAGIGKAFALYQLSVDAPVAIGKAFAAFPPPFSFIAAASVGAAMAAQTAKVVGANFQDGGIVPGSSFSGDNVPANVNSGEMILNRQQQSNLFNIANQGGQGGSKEIVVNTSIKVGEEEIARAVSRQVANGFELGEQT